MIATDEDVLAALYEEEELLLLAAASVLVAAIEADEPPRKIPKKRSVWVRPWLMRRAEYRQYERLLVELHGEDVHGDRKSVV